MSAELMDQVRRCVADMVGKNWKEVQPDATLLEDLGIDGDDAFDFLARFAKRFKVDLSELDFYRHFHQETDLFVEPMHLAQWFWSWLRGRPRPASKLAEKVPIRLKDLVEAAAAGQWRKTGQDVVTKVRQE